MDKHACRKNAVYRIVAIIINIGNNIITMDNNKYQKIRYLWIFMKLDIRIILLRITFYPTSPRTSEKAHESKKDFKFQNTMLLQK